EGREAVVHTAALVALGRKQEGRVLEGNRRGVENVVGKAIAMGIARVVYVSSAVTLAREETHESAYTRSKSECERYVRALQERGAPIRTTYPGAVMGPDDPALSEANRGLLIVFRDLPVVTDGGIQIVDVRDVAAAHARLLEGRSAPGRHSLAGHFLGWGKLLDRLDEITGRRLLRLPVPGGLLRVSGAVADVVRRVWDFELPLTHEATVIMTRWTPPEGIDGAGIPLRDVRETLRDTIRWMNARGLVTARQAGAVLRGADFRH